MAAFKVFNVPGKEPYTRLPLARFGLLRASDNFLQEYNTTPAHYRPVYNVLTDARSGIVYRLHPELVHTDDTALLCGDCAKAVAGGKVPKLSLAAGVPKPGSEEAAQLRRELDAPPVVGREGKAPLRRPRE